jgi:lipid-binding SYLF domain-containing protein
MKPGTKKQIKGTLKELKGKANEQAGKVIQSSALTREGKEEKLAGIAEEQAGEAKKVFERLDEAEAVFRKVMEAPDSAIPQEFLDVAHCIVIVPGLKTAAFVIGGKYGKGFFSCRNQSGEGWSAPGAVRIEGGSLGLQMGGSETDLIMLVMNSKGLDKLLAGEFILGAEGSIAAGPVGRTASAQTDRHLNAEILSWSRSQGLFVGFALEGATLTQDQDDNATLYGKKLGNREIVTGGVPVPAAAEKLIALLNQHSARKPGAKPEVPETRKKASARKKAPLLKKKTAPAKKQAAQKRAASHPRPKAKAAAKARRAAPKKTARTR